MNIPCENPCIACPPSIGGGIGPVDPANPFVNLSAELPDVDNFIGRRYGRGLPPLGTTFYSVGCIGFCFSSVSQEAADLCAQQQAVLCQSTQWPNLVPGPDPRYPFIPEDRAVFQNNAQFCTFNCPDGQPFTFTVAAGLFTAFSQTAADLQAYSYACNKVVVNRLCLGDLIPSRCCSGTAFASSMVGSSINIPLTFSVVGSLPDGLLLSQNPTTAFIDGTPTTPGDYAFTISATDTLGNTMNKLVTMVVFGITNATTLTEAVLNEVYSEQLTTGGTPAGALTWSVSSGTLPDGLTLNTSTGEISGTPTTEETQVFTITVSDTVVSCSKSFSLTVASAGCVVFQDVTWNAPTLTTVGTGTVSGSAVLNVVESIGNTGANGLGRYQIDGTVPFTGDQTDCQATLVVTDLQSTGPDAVTFIQLVIIHSVSGFLLNETISNSQGLGPDGAGIYDFPFTIPASVGATLTVIIDCIANSQAGGTASYDVEITLGA